MQNTTQNLDEALLFSRNQVFCLKNFVYSSIIFAETSHAFSTYQCLQKATWDFLNFI